MVASVFSWLSVAAMLPCCYGLTLRHKRQAGGASADVLNSFLQNFSTGTGGILGSFGGGDFLQTLTGGDGGQGAFSAANIGSLIGGNEAQSGGSHVFLSTIDEVMKQFDIGKFIGQFLGSQNGGSGIPGLDNLFGLAPPPPLPTTTPTTTTSTTTTTTSITTANETSNLRGPDLSSLNLGTDKELLRLLSGTNPQDVPSPEVVLARLRGGSVFSNQRDSPVKNVALREPERRAFEQDARAFREAYSMREKEHI